MASGPRKARVERDMEPAGLPEGIVEAIDRWGYLALGVGVALGIPVPEDVRLLVAGYLAWLGMIGAMGADNTGY